MRRPMIALQALVLCACLARPAVAQESALRPGMRVRVTAPAVSPKPFVGVVDSVFEQGIVLRTGHEVRSSFRLSGVSQVEVSGGRKRPVWSMTAPLWLTAAAGGLGASLAYATSDDSDFLGREFAAAAGGTLGGVAGLLVGTAMAIGIKRDIWEPVDLNAPAARARLSPSLYVAPGMRGTRMGVRAAF